VAQYRIREVPNIVHAVVNDQPAINRETMGSVDLHVIDGFFAVFLNGDDLCSPGRILSSGIYSICTHCRTLRLSRLYFSPL
jgi:hypothetical protein